MKIQKALKSGSGFDSFVSLEKFREMYSKIMAGEDVNLSKYDTFNTKDLTGFLSALKGKKLKGELVTDNGKVISIVNSIFKKPQRVLVIDNHNFFHRVFHSMPVMTDGKGRETSVLKGLTNFLNWLFATQTRYSNIIFTSESEIKLYRQSYTEELGMPIYKANRSEKAPSLIQQIKMTEAFLEEQGFLVLKKDGYEADDLLASVVKICSENNIGVTAFTTDKDAYQLAKYPDFEILDPKSKDVFIASENIFEKFGITADKFLDYQAINGDVADNVPGIKGFGKVAAIELLEKYGSLDGVFENIDSVYIEEGMNKAKLASALKKQERLRLGKDAAYASRDLCSLREGLLTNEILNSSFIPKDLSLFKQALSEYNIKY